MPAQPVTLSFPTLVDTVVAFATVSAWNAYFGSVTFTLNGANLPAATAGVLGAVYSAQSAALISGSTWTVQTYDASYVDTITMIDAGGTLVTTQVPNKASFDKLKANVDQLKAGFDDLITKLVASGAMQA